MIVVKNARTSLIVWLCNTVVRVRNGVSSVVIKDAPTCELERRAELEISCPSAIVLIEQRDLDHVA